MYFIKFYSVVDMRDIHEILVYNQMMKILNLYDGLAVKHF